MVRAMMSAEATRLSITLYDDIKADTFDWWYGNIKSKTSSKYIKQLLDENPNIENIDVYINSYGGEVAEGIAIYSLLQRAKATVTVYVDGFACSIASVIAMAGSKVIMSPTSLMMVHHAWTIAAGNANELRKAADDVEVIDGASKQAYIIKCGNKITEEELDKLLDDETWLGAKTCVEKGFADEIADFKAPVIEEEPEGPEDPKKPEDSKELIEAKTNFEKFKHKFNENKKASVYEQYRDRMQKRKGE